ncbi:MAPK regulated corepressor interacting protein 2 isoform X2 [Brienomyrus brachyistius]|uniref:MAPK regulated corepressor interacting protein 2 isoform X2 n=1 Tax=Brienomyrus brachyistius TaxID=42636 RepID=UPI0020B32EE7|nr:MAPK regulated corepressor interacting protein 2 isoform X2 [Brienomyrus brachyistius]
MSDLYCLANVTIKTQGEEGGGPPVRAHARSPAPKLVFNRLNGKRYHVAPAPRVDSPPEGFTPAHEENVKFVYEEWQQVEQRLADGTQTDGGQGPVQYSEKTPNPGMKNFVPIDLEEWWAQRFLANIVNLS